MQMMENAHQVIYFLWEKESFPGAVKKNYMAKSTIEAEYIACNTSVVLVWGPSRALVDQWFLPNRTPGKHF